MKYQVFNRQEGDVKKMDEFLTMLRGALEKCNTELERLMKEDKERYATAKQYEESYGSDDALTQSAWNTWGYVYDDRQAVSARIEEIEDALRFVGRLRIGNY